MSVSQPIVCKDCWPKKTYHNAPCEHVVDLVRRLMASEAHSENLDKSLTRTEEKLKAAIETLERVNGRAQMADFDMGYVETSKALRDIRAWCTEALTPRAEEGEDE